MKSTCSLSNHIKAMFVPSDINWFQIDPNNKIRELSHGTESYDQYPRFVFNYLFSLSILHLKCVEYCYYYFSGLFVRLNTSPGVRSVTFFWCDVI